MGKGLGEQEVTLGKCESHRYFSPRGQIKDGIQFFSQVLISWSNSNKVKHCENK